MEFPPGLLGELVGLVGCPGSVAAAHGGQAGVGARWRERAGREGGGRLLAGRGPGGGGLGEEVEGGREVEAGGVGGGGGGGAREAPGVVRAGQCW